jgi:selenium metabolism protein YedF
MFIPQQEEIKCEVPTKTDNSFVVVVSSNVMGHGDDKLGSILIKGFIYSLTCLETLPKAVIFYNSGVKLAVEGSEVLEDLKTLADAGVEIVACGTCLEFYQLKEKLAVGKIVNMLDIVERQAKATKVVKP